MSSRFLIALGLVLSVSFNRNALQAEEWIELFDGKTTVGWKANEKPECFTMENGELKL
jgi:hypothetical protein